MAMQKNVTSKTEGKKKGFLKKYGWGFILQGVPIIGILGDFSMPNVRLVWRELEGNIIGPEGILMLPIAGILDVAKIIVSVIELFIADVDLGLVSTIIGWLSWGIFFLWMYIRGNKSAKDIVTQMDDKEKPITMTVEQLPLKGAPTEKIAA